MTLTALEASAWSELGTVIDPEIRKPITELGMVNNVREKPGGALSVRVLLTVAHCPAAQRIKNDVEAALARAVGADAFTLTVGVMDATQRAAFVERARGTTAERTIPFGVHSPTRVIAITSGKGGVGKSTIAANLAVACAQQGLAVGLVDADVHGFSIPGILGLDLSTNGRPTRIDTMIVPPVAHGVKTISIGMFLEPDGGTDQAVAWRGPMLHRTLQQFLRDVHFGDLDILFLDLPPGTGDVAISLGQLLPGADVVVVTTPQIAAADVAVRSGLVARQTGQRVIGVIENMAGSLSPDTAPLFGSGGGYLVAERVSNGQETPVPLLASIPLSVTLRADGDAGTPCVIEHPRDTASQTVQTLAKQLASHSSPPKRLPLRVRS